MLRRIAEVACVELAAWAGGAEELEPEGGGRKDLFCAHLLGSAERSHYDISCDEIYEAPNVKRPLHEAVRRNSPFVGLAQAGMPCMYGLVEGIELVVLGARAKARRLPDCGEEARRAREELAEWIRSGTGPEMDVEAAEEVKHRGLIAE